ncbi:hypothetical protein PPERSA_08707 [Pseudocohnilembus persalinus]|uniref:Tyrosine--tRNA ligase n=1 Tax=Pseudocohnilembus persalinus TaxID=266149 RepID=A0A0V0R929_PSEPJ|nr:hypothetical protein PPERSA_08707 [Pseudocohnilembus persalinus]|eukprot:KRX10712.1 hypothetical protein PPERSA_08707 [Pseudocohnilembus persalinus]
MIQKSLFRTINKTNLYKFSNFNAVPPAEHLKSRGLLNQYSHEELFQKDFYKMVQNNLPKKENNNNDKTLSVYCGFDPTAESLHLGNLLTIIALIRLSFLGFRPILLVGGATGQIGDPSGKTKDRQLQEIGQTQKNIQGITKTLTQVTDSIYAYLKENYQLQSEQQYKIVDNAEFYKNQSVIDFIRDVGQYYRMGNLLSKEIISSRIKSENGLSFTEFTYTLLQGNDFEKLFQNHNCVMQIGGSDQWGNIMSGLELVKKKHNKNVYCMTIPLLLTSTGQKFGKSEGNALWIDLQKYDSNQLYQYLLNQPDEMVGKLLRMYSFMSEEQIQNVEKEHQAEPEKRIGQKTLADTIIKMLTFNFKKKGLDHSEIQDLFSTNFQELKNWKEEEVAEYFRTKDDIVIKNNKQEILEKCKNFQDLIVNYSGLKKNKSEVKRVIESGGFQVNGEKINLEDSKNFQSNFQNYLIHNQFMVVKMGKKQIVIFKFD